MDRVYLDMCSLKRPFDDQRQLRVRELDALGFQPLDALHVAFAERAGARWFVTCDDGLLRVAGRFGNALRTLVVAPGELDPRSQA